MGEWVGVGGRVHVCMYWIYVCVHVVRCVQPCMNEYVLYCLLRRTLWDST